MHTSNGLYTVWKWVDPVLVQPHGDGVHLCLTCSLLQLSPLLGQSALHHGSLGQRAIWILMDSRGKVHFKRVI